MSFLEQVLATTIGILLGTLFATIITGLLANKFIIKRIMQNKDIQDLFFLFKEGKDLLKQLLAEQKAKK